MLYSVAKLESGRVEEIRALEKEIGKTLVAFSGHDIKTCELSEDHLSKLKGLEEKTGLALVAVNT